LGERGGRDGANDVGVALGLTSNQHAVTMARRRPGTQPDFAVPPAVILDGPMVDSHPEWGAVPWRTSPPSASYAS
jgi:hypothetical protein